jgi:CheY-like chemotaxis protein
MTRHAPENILVVDDDSGVRRLVRATLQNAGYKILEATWGREGLKRFSEHHADTGPVLSDLSITAMTGSEMIRHILKNRPVRPSDVRDWDDWRTQTTTRALKEEVHTAA